MESIKPRKQHKNLSTPPTWLVYSLYSPCSHSSQLLHFQNRATISATARRYVREVRIHTSVKLSVNVVNRDVFVIAVSRSAIPLRLLARNRVSVALMFTNAKVSVKMMVLRAVWIVK